jgi:hypothetical protein
MLKQAVAHKLAEGFSFEPDKLLSYLEQRLSLTGEQLDGMRPVAVTITDALNKTLDTWSEQGFVDLHSLGDDLLPVADEARSALQQVLDTGQMEEFEAFLANLDEEALEAIRNSLVEKLAVALKLREDQVKKLKPILRQHVEQLGTLLSGFAGASDRSFEEFSASYDMLRNETRDKLKDVLDADQFRRLTAQQDEIRERVRALLF